ncbi:MAG: PQQ-dependent sugar dehydrogenase [Pirellulales bacterium]
MHRKLWTPWKSLLAARSHRPKQHLPSARLHFQPLEDRLALTTLPTGFTETLVTTEMDMADRLSSPTAMEFSPIGELWVLEQGGKVKLVRGDGSIHTAETLSVHFTGERGLLGIAFDSNYDGTGPNADYIYLYYTDPPGPLTDPANNRLSRFTVTGAGTATPDLGSESILRDLPQEADGGNTNHNGGAIHFGPDGKLYVAVGDHNYDNIPQSEHVSQVTDTPFGKILRLNADGSDPVDNPFYVENPPDNWVNSIWALGLRNPFTFAFDPDSGTMFINDVGESSWEEINEGRAGANYGWSGRLNITYPVWEGFLGAGPTWAEDYRDPQMAYDHSNSPPTPAGVAITGGAFYPSNSQFGSNYAGLYFFADYGANFIRIFDPDNPGSLATPDTSLGFATSPTTSAPVDLKLDAASNLYYLARGFSGFGEVYRISYTGGYGPTSVAARQIFYNNSTFDGDDAAANAQDDAAIAPGKTAYLPGAGTALSSSVTSYSRGINGVMIDLAGNHGPLTPADFTFKVGANNTPGTWAAAPAPTDVVVRAGAGAGGADRVEIIWADGAITNTWLEVIVEGNDASGGFNSNTGLPASNVFFFGNRVGDTLTDASPTFLLTNAVDVIATRMNGGAGATISNLYDFDRNGLVNSADQIISRGNAGLTSRINIPSPPPAPEATPSSSSTLADDGSVSAVASALAEPSSRRESDPDASRPPAAPPDAVTDRGPLARLLAHAADESASRSRGRLAEVDPFSTVGELDDELLDELLSDLARE